MCAIKCPKFINNSHKILINIVDKECRKVHLLNVCCGKYEECKICKKDSKESINLYEHKNMNENEIYQ